MAFDTASARANRFFPASVEDKLIGVTARFTGFCLLGVIAFAWLSLVTWTATDPSLTLATSGPVTNVAGAPGAIIADLLLKTVGFASVVLLFAPMFWGVQMATTRTVPGFRGKVIFFPLSILAAAGAFSALPASETWPIDHGYGGILGDFVFGLFAGLFAILNQARAGLAAGLLLSAISASAILHSIGLQARDVHRILFKPIQDVNWREKAGSWQNVLLNEAQRVRDSMRVAREHVTLAAPELSSPVEDESLVTADRRKVPPQIIVADPDADDDASPSVDVFQQDLRQDETRTRDWRPAAQVRREDNRPAVLSPAGLNPLLSGHQVPRTPEPTPQALASAYRAPQTPVAEHELPSTLPRPISNPFEARPGAVPRTGTAEVAQRPMSPAVQSGGYNAGPVAIAEKFAAHVASGIDVLDEADLDELGAESRAIARRFAPASAGIETAPPPASTASPPAQPSNAQSQGAPAGTQVPAHMQAAAARPRRPRYMPPSTRLLARPEAPKAFAEQNPEVLRARAEELQSVLGDFGVNGEVKNIRPGPVVTLYEFEPARGTKSSRVIALADDIARSMSAVSARVAVVPGRNAIGIELPNSVRSPVLLRALLDSNDYRSSGAALPLTLGKSIGGDPVIADLARMPHLLVAGTTGSGKSVGVNAMVLSILFKHAPDKCRMLMIDPKMLELSVYNDIPHLLSPVITDPQKAVVALNWAVHEMEERYKRMSKLSVRNIGVYNNRVRNAKTRGESLSRTVHTGFDANGKAVYEQQTMELEELPHIVIVVDEFADLMLVAGKEIEAAIQRLAQMARAAGIHLIMATQRPSVDVITGTIKANFPTRISFKVTSKVDSRTILNEQGAEQLLGQGDMLYASGSGQTVRVHGPFVSDDEVEAVAEHLRSQGAPAYVAAVTEAPEVSEQAGAGTASDSSDLYDQAVAIVLRDGKASTSYIQRRLSIGYNRAADLIERMEQHGVISAAGSGGRREILISSSAAEKGANSAA